MGLKYIKSGETALFEKYGRVRYGRVPIALLA
jgi:hypothetical protein